MFSKFLEGVLEVYGEVPAEVPLGSGVLEVVHGVPGILEEIP